MPATKKVVIFGATGVIGTLLAEILSREQPDWEIHAVSRKADGSSRLEKLGLANVTMETGDPTDKEAVLKLTEEADIVVSCIGLHRYEAKYWATQWPIIANNLLAGTVQEGRRSRRRRRRLVFCDNLYAYGAGHKTPISPQTPTVEPSTKAKPNVRSLLRQTFVAHMGRHPGTLAVVGGSDFFGPHVTATSFLGDTFAGKIVGGRAPLAVGSAATVHDFCYAPDLARALAVACVDDGALDGFWICPHAIRDKTMTEIAQDVAAKADPAANNNGKVYVLPKFVVWLLAPFDTFMWEIIEMLPFWMQDYKVDDSDFVNTFGIQATPYDQALDELVAFFQEHNNNN